MSSRPDLKWVGFEGGPLETHLQERIEDYLDNLCAPLTGVLPYGERRSLRREVCTHLDGLILEYREQGLTPEESVETALREFGEPWQVGRSFLREWCQGSPGAGAARLTRKATVHAFAWFGIATVLNLFLVEAYALEYLPASLSPLLFLLVFLSPLVAGSLTGVTASARAGRGVGNAMTVLFVHALVAGLLLLPSAHGLLFALFQLLFWAPAGALSAEGASSLIRHYRRQRFLSLVH